MTPNDKRRLEEIRKSINKRGGTWNPHEYVTYLLDLVERLEAERERDLGLIGAAAIDETRAPLLKAAEAENARLREALDLYARGCTCGKLTGDVARAALKGEG